MEEELAGREEEEMENDEVVEEAEERRMQRMSIGKYAILGVDG